MSGARSLQPRKRPVQERSRLTVEAVLDAAIQVFEQYGYAAGTTARIAERAGVSVGSLYQYFPNKDAILVALAERHLAELRELGRQLPGRVAGAQPLGEFFQLLVEGFVELHLRSPAVHRLLAEELVLPAEARLAFDRLAEELAGQLAAALAVREDLQTADHRTLAYFCMHILERMTHVLVLHPPEQFSRASYVTETVRILVGYARQHVEATQ